MELDFDKLREIAQSEAVHVEPTDEQVKRCALMIAKAGYTVNDEWSYRQLSRYLAVIRFGKARKGLRWYRGGAPEIEMDDILRNRSHEVAVQYEYAMNSTNYRPWVGAGLSTS